VVPAVAELLGAYDDRAEEYAVVGVTSSDLAVRTGARANDEDEEDEILGAAAAAD
jgi:hypothetical protein